MRMKREKNRQKQMKPQNAAKKTSQPFGLEDEPKRGRPKKTLTVTQKQDGSKNMLGLVGQKRPSPKQQAKAERSKKGKK